MKTSLLRPDVSTTLLARLINTPDLVHVIRALPAPTFSTLIRHIGLEDAGEIIALATTNQLVAVFDEDLFINTQPGEREVFDTSRFILWLDVLLEAGESVAACRIAELSEDFVTKAFSSIILVLDHDALRAHMGALGDDAHYVDKIIESTHSEVIDGYLLISRIHDGWDTVFALILALDRDHRSLLTRILDRCAYIASDCINDPDELFTMLSAEDALTEDVEAEREDRRSKQGYVEPRAARNFLALAQQPLTTDAVSSERDPVTCAYLRDFDQPLSATDTTFADSLNLVKVLSSIDIDQLSQPVLPPAHGNDLAPPENLPALVVAMRLLKERAPQVFSERMGELAYLVNVIVAGAGTRDKRFRPKEAAEAVLATVGLGAELVIREKGSVSSTTLVRASADELCSALHACHADLLFRMASSTLVTRNATTESTGFVGSYDELERVIEQL